MSVSKQQFITIFSRRNRRRYQIESVMLQKHEPLFYDRERVDTILDHVKMLRYTRGVLSS